MLERLGDTPRLATTARINPSLCLPAGIEGLVSYPDQAFASFLLQEIQSGFQSGVPANAVTRSATRNLQSAGEHSLIVQQYLDREEHLGRVQRISAHEEALLPTLQMRPFGVIPKRYQPDKWCLIIDLSSPHGHSINDAISKDLSSVSYTSLCGRLHSATGRRLPHGKT